MNSKRAAQMLKKLSIATPIACVLLGFSILAPAKAFNIFTDRDAWEGAVGRFVTEEFSVPNQTIPVSESLVLPTGLEVENLTFPELPTVSIEEEELTSGIGVRRPEFGEGGEIKFTFPRPVFAWGADFRDTADSAGLVVSGEFDNNFGPDSVVFQDELGMFQDELGIPGFGFLGIAVENDVSPFSSIVFDASDPNPPGFAINEFFFVDNVSFKEVSEPPTIEEVSEPSTVLVPLIAIGVGATLKRERSKQQKKRKSKVA